MINTLTDAQVAAARPRTSYSDDEILAAREAITLLVQDLPIVREMAETPLSTDVAVLAHGCTITTFGAVDRWRFSCGVCGEDDTNGGDGFCSDEFARSEALVHAQSYHPHEVTR